METVATLPASAEQRERLFFLSMAISIAATVVVAFSPFYVAGISSFGAPWWVHVHGLTFVAWIVFYVLQNTLVFRDDIALHRKLGRIGAGYAVWMVLVGLILTPLTLAVGRSPPFFTPPYFLALDWVNIAVFGALIYAATMTAPLNVALLLVYVIVAALFAWGNRGRVHPAYGWGAGALVLFAAATELLSIFPPFAALAARIVS